MPAQIPKSRAFSAHVLSSSPFEVAAVVRWSIVVTLACVLLAAKAAAQPARGGPSPYENLRTLARVLAHVEASYVEVVDQDEALKGAIRGMVASLDPHSAYLDASEYRLLMSDTAGRFAGIGVEINVHDGWLTVTGVFPGGPAARAGMQVGDRFLSIEGAPARDMSILDAVQRMRGEPGTHVHVQLRRDDQGPALELDLRRAFIQVDAVETKLLPGGVAWVKVRAFQQTTGEELGAALDAAARNARASGGVRGVLIDLRDNPGGLVDQAVVVADEFLDSGTIVSTRGRGGQLLSESKARGRGTRPNWPVVVLINGFTASAAEIVAAALRDHQRATLVGEATFGKGSVQNIIELPDGSALKLTVARYYTPAGVSLQARGIEPDIRVARVVQRGAQKALRESDLEGHLEADRAGPGPLGGSTRHAPHAPAEDAPAARPFADDNQASVGFETLLTLIAERERAAKE